MSEDTPRLDREGIHIERELAERIAIEEGLDANVTSEFRFPAPSRRRISAWVYLLAAVVATPSFRHGWMVGIGFIALAGWQWLSAWPLNIDERQAMTTAATVVDFPIGHASASVRFSGWRSKPRWSVVMYSAAEPPDRRGLVVVDAVTGEILGAPYLEDIPD